MKAYIANRQKHTLAIATALTLFTAAASHAQEPRHFTLESAIQTALEQSSTLARAQNQLARGDLVVSEARSQFLPNLTLSASTGQSYNRLGSGADAGLGSSSTGTASVQLGTSMTLFNGFGNVATLRGVQIEAQAGELDLERTRQTVIFAVISGYLSLIEAQQQLRVAVENLESQQQQEARIQVLVEGGTRPIAELFQQQAAVANARAVQVRAQQALEEASIALVQSMRLNPRGEYSFQAPALPEPTRGLALDTEALVQRALSQRTDLRATASRVSAAEQDVRAAGASWWPTLSLSAGYGTTYASAGNLAMLNQLDQRQSGSVSLGLSFPLFDRHASQRAVERAQLQVRDAQIAAEDARQQVEVEVQRAVLGRQSADAALAAAEARVAAAQQALTATERRYDAGVATLFEVSQTRADFVDATSAAVRARYTLHFQDAVLEYYTGTLAAE
jgi:outer membrane protein